MLLTLEQSTYVGPASVVQVAAGRMRLAFPDQEVWATLAIAYPYRPVPGDVVLVVGQDENWYVIGVLQGQGKTSFTVPGDLELRAPGGRINIMSGKGIRLVGPAIKLETKKLEVIAKTVVETFTNARRWVKESFQLRAGRFRTLVKSTYRVDAGKIVERAKRDVKIDGRKIHLG